MGVEGIILKYHSHAPKLWGKGGYILLAKKDVPFGGTFQAA